MPRASPYVSFKRSLRELLGLNQTLSLHFDLVIATIVANRWPGDPLWLMLVAPPAWGKTLALSCTYNASDEVYPLTKLTPRTLVSGWGGEYGADDCSLIPKINGKVLMIEDFTVIMCLRHETMLEILSQLRAAYGGKLAYEFGTGAQRIYDCKFGLVGAVTDVIDTHAATMQQLGERFLKYRLRGIDMRDRISRALDQAHDKDNIIKTITGKVTKILSHVEKDPPKVPLRLRDRLFDIAGVIGDLRSEPYMDRTRAQVVYRPMPESPLRLALQLQALAKGLAAIRLKDKVTITEIDDCARVAWDTLSGRTQAVLHALWEPDADGSTALSTVKIASKTQLGYQVVRNDLAMFQSMGAAYYTSAKELRSCTDEPIPGNEGLWKMSEDLRKAFSLYNIPVELGAPCGSSLRRRWVRK